MPPRRQFRTPARITSFMLLINQNFHGEEVGRDRVLSV